MLLPCSIQLVPRVERRSIIYVDGKDNTTYGTYGLANGRRSGASGDGGRPLPAVTTPPAAVDTPSEVLFGARVASVGLPMSAAIAGATVAVPTPGAPLFSPEATAGGGEGGVFAINTDGEMNGAEDALDTRREDALRLVGEMEISKPAYLQVWVGCTQHRTCMKVIEEEIGSSAAQA